LGAPDATLIDNAAREPGRGKLGSFETRLASCASEVDAAQALRYQVFCTELHAQNNDERQRFQREADKHDANCDHLLLLSNENTSPIIPTIDGGRLVGTQRFLVRDGRVGPSEFYSGREFQISQMLEKFPEKRFMELGRSCILPEFRDKRTMELLWHGTWDYALKQNADVMFGCASFHTQNVSEISDALGFLAEHAPLKGDWKLGSTRVEHIDMREYLNTSRSSKTAIRSLPPLIKGYLRLGAMFSTDAVPDPDFGTIDVLVVLPIAAINPRYVKYYGANADRHST